MSLLMRNATVTTRYGGGFVESIDGHSGGHEGGAAGRLVLLRQRRQAPKGAAETERAPGRPRLVGPARLEPDRRSAGRRRLLPGAVPARDRRQAAAGARGMRARRPAPPAARSPPVCAPPACLRAVAALGPAGEEPDTLRVLVGTWSQVSGDPGAQEARKRARARAACTRASRPPGGRIALLDAQGATVRTLTGSAGLIAATRYAEEEPVWVDHRHRRRRRGAAPPARSTKRRSTIASPLAVAVGAVRPAGPCARGAEMSTRAPKRSAMTRRLLLYRPLASPLHATRAGVAALWALALTPPRCCSTTRWRWSRSRSRCSAPAGGRGWAARCCARAAHRADRGGADRA